jgi:hypothetical protein
MSVGIRRCRVCGCTDNDCHQCVEKTGHPCHWVAEDLCSACADEDDDFELSTEDEQDLLDSMDDEDLDDEEGW